MMKKQMLVGMLVLCGAFALAGCKHEHVWEEATCETAKYCTECEATEGEALGHAWEEATCTLPKTCKVCGTTEGVRAGHKFLDATCDKPKEGEVCGETKGEPLVHNGRRVGRCKLCGVVQNKELVTEIGDRYETAYSEYVTAMTAIMQDTTELAEELVRCLQPPILLCLEQDMAKALGQALAVRMGEDARILCIDRVRLRTGDYLDVGPPVGPALPVVVKTLVLEG